MQAILKIKSNEIDDRLLNIIKELLSKNIEIVIKKQLVELEEFDKTLSLDEINQEFEKVGYSQEFLNDLKIGFATSERYALKNENKVFEG